MSRRKTISLNIPVAVNLINQKFFKNADFCRAMGRPNQRTWISEWQRKDKVSGDPAPANLPSPEEAAQMCVLLQVQPEEILLEQSDIELVHFLLDQQRSARLKSKDALPDEDVLFALFEGRKDITLSMWKEVKNFANFVYEREANQKDE